MTEMNQFRVWENQSTNLGEFDDQDEAVNFAQERHTKYMDRWHEIYRFGEENKTGHGMAQWKPDDCPKCHTPCKIVEKADGAKVYLCKRCEHEIPYRQKCYFKIVGYCDECTRPITDTIAFKTKIEECYSIHASNLRARALLERQRWGV